MRGWSIKTHSWYRLIAAIIVFTPRSWTPNVSRIEAAIFIVGLWIMAEIAQLREEGL